MKVASYNRLRFAKKKRTIPRWLKISFVCLGAVLVIFVLANLVMGALYRNKVLPNYSVASVPIGNTGFDQLDDKVSVDQLLPAKIVFSKDDKKTESSPEDLGVTVDWDATQENIKKSRSWLPVASLFFKKSVPVELKLDNAKFAASAEGLEAEFIKEALPERIAFEGDNFAIVAPEPGYQLDVVELRLDLVGLLEQGKDKLTVPTKPVDPAQSTGGLQDELSALQKKLDAKITLINAGQSKELNRAQIASFYEPFGQTLKLSDEKIGQVIAYVAASFGINPVNQGEAVKAATYAVEKQQPVNFVLANQGVKVYHYCTAARGLDASVLGEYRLKLAAVYGDPRGWNDGGALALVYAESGCDYTAWLSAPSSMTSFGGVCDSYYSCRIGANVVVNYDRWMGATDPWNAAGGSLEDYRVMVINHETGHWFGFGHRNCPAAGQPAPVMQQQSISLQGCNFNPWPIAAELAVL